MKRLMIILALIAVIIPVNAQRRTADLPKWPGVCETPQMGWSSWNKFMTDINEDIIKQTVDAMVDLGLVDAGYVYVNIDDGWHGQRNELGFVQGDPEKFPSGMKALGEYIHSKGLKFGIYSDAGDFTCNGCTGSRGYEYQDALTYASWEVDYVKYDWCSTQNVNAKDAYITMRNAITKAGRPMVFSMCEWGTSKPWEWAEPVAHSWRTTHDIGPAFLPAETSYFPDGRRRWKPQSVYEIIEQTEPLRKYAGPGHWNDPDMLEVGNVITVDEITWAMTESEDRAHFTMWCMLAAPLILGNDLRDISAETLAIITNKDVIAIDQDPLGVQGLRLKKENDLQYWFKPLVGGDWAFCIMNTGPEAAKLSLDWSELEVDDDLSGRKTDFANITYTAHDLWNKSAKPFNTKVRDRKRQMVNNVVDVTVPSHDVLVYRLSPVL
jgi:alpha-galactosidase